MIAVLREGVEASDGRILAPIYEGDADAHKKHHHVELLEDCGLAEWLNDGVARVTYAGYGFLEGLNTKASAWDKLNYYIEKGIPITTAVAKLLEWLPNSD